MICTVCAFELAVPGYVSQIIREFKENKQTKKHLPYFLPHGSVAPDALLAPAQQLVAEWIPFQEKGKRSSFAGDGGDCGRMYSFARAALTKSHRLHG